MGVEKMEAYKLKTSQSSSISLTWKGTEKVLPINTIAKEKREEPWKQLVTWELNKYNSDKVLVSKINYIEFNETAGKCKNWKIIELAH